MSTHPIATDVRLIPLTHADVSWLHVHGDHPERKAALARLAQNFNNAKTKEPRK